jgi:peptide deformylase
MAKLEIKKYGEPVLRKKVIAVSEITEDIEKLAVDMLETMYAAPGVGLAAPQVGISLRLCVIDVSQDRKSPLIMINPKVIAGDNEVFAKEGCLSFPDCYESVKRFGNVVAEYVDLKGKKIKIKSEEWFLSRAIQHEIDHLDAKLFIDYLSEWKRKTLEKKIKRRKKAGRW